MFNFFAGMPGASFEAHYRALPVAFIDKPQAEDGDKVFLPPSALDRLASLHVEYPMLFRIESKDRNTHCGVLEFVADEGCVYMPHWMMQNLLLQVGDMVKLRNVSLPKGQYVKLQPVTSDFLDISNPKAVLERSLRSYSCLTKGDCFVINYNNKKYEIEVKETKPGNAISIIETDCQVDFDAPKDYKEPERVPRPAAVAAPEPMQEDQKQAAAGATAQQEEPEEPKFVPFLGSARRLDGKGSQAPSPSPGAASAAAAAARSGAASSLSNPQPSTSAAAPPTKAGTVVVPSSGNRLLDKLQREKAAAQGASGSAPVPAPPAPPADEKKEDPFKAFQGKGYSLK